MSERMNGGMLAQLAGRREWRLVVALVLSLAVAGCGGGNLGELLKDSPSQQQKEEP